MTSNKNREQKHESRSRTYYVKNSNMAKGRSTGWTTHNALDSELFRPALRRNTHCASLRFVAGNSYQRMERERWMRRCCSAGLASLRVPPDRPSAVAVAVANASCSVLNTCDKIPVETREATEEEYELAIIDSPMADEEPDGESAGRRNQHLFPANPSLEAGRTQLGENLVVHHQLPLPPWLEE